MDTKRATRSQQRGNHPQTPQGRQPNVPEPGLGVARGIQTSPYPDSARARQRTPSS